VASNGQAIKQEVFRLAPTRAATRKRNVGLGMPLQTQASGAQLLNKFFWLELTPTQARQDQSRTAIDGRNKLKKAIKRGTDPLQSGTSRMAKFVSMFTKERNSGREQMPLEWTFETDSAGVVRVGYKQADPLAVFRSWVEFGLSNATAIAEAMDVSVGHVSKLAKRAVGAGWLKVQGRKYILVSGVPV